MQRAPALRLELARVLDHALDAVDMCKRLFSPCGIRAGRDAMLRDDSRQLDQRGVFGYRRAPLQLRLDSERQVPAEVVSIVQIRHGIRRPQPIRIQPVATRDKAPRIDQLGGRRFSRSRRFENEEESIGNYCSVSRLR